MVSLACGEVVGLGVEGVGVERGGGGGGVGGGGDGCLATGLTSVTTAWLAPHIFSDQYVTKEEMEEGGGVPRGDWEEGRARAWINGLPLFS